MAEPGNDLSNIEDFTNDFQVKLRIYNHSVYIYIYHVGDWMGQHWDLKNVTLDHCSFKVQTIDSHSSSMCTKQVFLYVYIVTYIICIHTLYVYIHYMYTYIIIYIYTYLIYICVCIYIHVHCLKPRSSQTGMLSGNMTTQSCEQTLMLSHCNTSKIVWNIPCGAL